METGGTAQERESAWGEAVPHSASRGAEKVESVNCSRVDVRQKRGAPSRMISWVQTPLPARTPLLSCSLLREAGGYVS